MLDVDLTRGGVRLDTVESHDRITDPADEATTSMGDRTGAVAGINGDYFDIHKSGAPLGGVMRSGELLKSPRPNYQAQLTVRFGGTARVGEVDFHGSVRDASDATAVTSLNTVGDAATGGISELTPALGATAPVTAGTLVIGRWRDGVLTVKEVRASVTSVPALAPGQRALLGSGRGGAWLQAHVQTGERLRVSAGLSDRNATALLSGATVLVRNGRVYDDPTGTPPSGRNPETMVGVSDGGGSSTLAARAPGSASLTIRNTVSDAAGERPVANGLFVYRVRG